MSEEKPQKEERIAVTLPPALAKRLKALSTDVSLSTGLLARALIEASLDRTEEPDVVAAIARIYDADRERRRKTAVAVNEARGAKNKALAEKNKKKKEENSE